MTARALGKGLERVLHDPRRADVDPGARGHLPIHDETLALELPEVFPGRPARNQERVRDQHARRIDVGLEDADRLARLDQQRLVVIELPEDRDQAIKGLPAAWRLSGASID